MVDTTQRTKAETFRALHDGPILVLPNAWDAGSAALIQHAGAKAIATTSGGVSWALGHGDGQRLIRDEMVEAVRRVVDTVRVPVTADIEGGYGPRPKDVAATVSAIVEVGAVGVNLEDSKADSAALFTAEEQAGRLRAARTAALEAGLPELVINCRTDVYLFGIGEPEGRFDDVLARAYAYAEAGADCLFVPGLIDLDALGLLVKESPLPVNAMAWPGAPTVAEFEAVGVRRVSLGTALAQAAYSSAHRASVELLDKGTYSALEGAIDFGAVNSLFS